MSRAAFASQPGLQGVALVSFSEHIDERKICNAVSPDKDVDGFHVINVGRMCLDQYSMLPATPWGVWEILKRTGRCVFKSHLCFSIMNILWVGHSQSENLKAFQHCFEMLIK